MREQFRDRYLQYDDPIAEHRMLWRAHSLPPEECISCRPEYRRPMQLERLRSKVRRYDSTVQGPQEGILWVTSKCRE